MLDKRCSHLSFGGFHHAEKTLLLLGKVSEGVIWQKVFPTQTGALARVPGGEKIRKHILVCYRFFYPWPCDTLYL